MSSPPDDINQAFDQLELEDTTTTTNAAAPFRTSLAELQAAPDPRANWRPRRGRRERPRLPPAWIEDTPQPQPQPHPQRLDLEYADDETLVSMGILDPPEEPGDAGSQQPEQPEQADLLGYADDETLMKMGILYPPMNQNDAGPGQGGQTEQVGQATEATQAEQPQQAKKAKKAKKVREAEPAKQAEETGQPESSTQAARRGDKSPARTRNCAVCLQDKDILDTTPLLCGHDICSGCMNNFFEKSLVDESIFPPQCCTKPIPLDRARIVLKQGLVEKFEKRRVEIETINRTYCHVPDCRTFINPVTIAGVVGICPECDATTCTMCKHPAHSGPCPDDPDTRAVLDMALRNGWKRCYNCSCVVERQGDGCEHMICILCHADFCYDCGEPWTPDHHRGNHQDGRTILSGAHAFPVVTEAATEAESPGIQAPPDEEEDEDDGYDGDDDDEDAVGELIDVYFDPGDSSPEHGASQGKIDESNQSPEDSDSDEDVFYDAVEYQDEEDDSDEDVFYDAVEYQDEEDDSDEDVFYDAVEYMDEEENEKEKEEELKEESDDEETEEINEDPIGEPVGEPVLEPGDEPCDAGAEEQGEEYVEEFIDNPLASEDDADSDADSEAESEAEEISDNDETAQKVLDGLGYNCEHNGWMDAHSRGRCGDCTKELRGYGWKCLQCELVVCSTCRIFFARDAVRRVR